MSAGKPLTRMACVKIVRISCFGFLSPLEITKYSSVVRFAYTVADKVRTYG